MEIEDGKKKRAPDTAERYQLRLPDGLLNKVRQSAKRNNRTMNSEIVHILELSFSETLESVKSSGYIYELKKIIGKLEKTVVYEEVRSELLEDPDFLFKLKDRLGAEGYQKFLEYSKVEAEILDKYAPREYDRQVNYGGMDWALYEDMKKMEDEQLEYYLSRGPEKF